jgi:drug/metabolite transporter (DMT)-like permease
MPDGGLAPLFFGLASAFSWGAADFSGGVATKRSAVYTVIVASQLIGGLYLLALAFMLSEPVPAVPFLLLGSLAGIFGAAGLVALYTALAQGQMGVVSPVAALVTALLPVVVSFFGEGLPKVTSLLGFGLAFIAVWFLSRGNSRAPIHLRELKLPMAAGAAFGMFFILINQVSAVSVLWPLVAARFASVVLVFLFALARRQIPSPDLSQLPIIALTGVLDSTGNAFFALATRTGRLDIAAVVSSLYPASTVLLAWLVLKEKLARRQWVGVLLALLALALIAA